MELQLVLFVCTCTKTDGYNNFTYVHCSCLKGLVLWLSLQQKKKSHLHHEDLFLAFIILKNSCFRQKKIDLCLCLQKHPFIQKNDFLRTLTISYICNVTSTYLYGAVVVMIVWLLDLQLPMQLVPITTNVMSSNPAQKNCTRNNIM